MLTELGLGYLLRLVIKVTQEKLDRYNRAPLERRELIFKLLDADVKLGLCDHCALWVDGKIVLGGPNPKARFGKGK